MREQPVRLKSDRWQCKSDSHGLENFVDFKKPRNHRKIAGFPRYSKFKL
jgi:hypothetical protein